MNIVIGSAFRNSGRHVSKYFEQVFELKAALGRKCWPLRMIAVEGDSVDDTQEWLLEYAKIYNIELDLVIRNHGKKIFGSTEEPERFKALSYVGEGILEAVKPRDHVLVYVESDLIWDADTILGLILRVAAIPDFDIVAPLVYANGAFYDIWAFRENGQRFSPFPPYAPSLQPGKSLPTFLKVDSVGSCLIIKAEVARTCRMNGECLVGFCNDARAKGFEVWAAMTHQIQHPA